jgi:hypothetical protein
MSGSNDQLANVPPGVDQVSPRVPDQVSRREPDPVGPRESDPVGPRESDPIGAEFQERMERLPPGHPSSPYNDDGSPKPPLPDLSEYELPIPGDPDYRPEPLSASEADCPEAVQTPENVTPGTNPDEHPGKTAGRPELWEVPPDVEPPTDAEYTGYDQEVREWPGQESAWGLAGDEEDTPGVRDEVSQEEREASHSAPADDLDERTANELPVPGDPDDQPEPSRAFEAEEPTDEGSVGADDLQRADDKPAADEPAPDSEAARTSDSEDEPRSGPDGSWEWQGRSLTPEESRSADQTLARWVAAEGRDADGNYGEHGLTPAMRRIEAQLEHGKLVADTEKFALKRADRFKLKLAERINLQPGESAVALASRVHDGIRYTFEYNERDYTIGTEETETVLNRSGYELITRKPSWHSPDYKGMNSQWRDPDSGLLFEVQFHTHASWDAKQRTHLAYEQLANPRTGPEERERLDAYQKEIAASVPIPPGALEIPYYHKEGE